MNRQLPVAIIGAGPVGLAAAAHALSRGLSPIVFEAGPAVGAGIRRWGHVRVFSPWKFNIDKAAEALLLAAGWSRPDGDTFPTGREIVENYLEPLATRTALSGHVHCSTRVLSVTRENHDLMKDGVRDAAPFILRVAGPSGEDDIRAQAVIDASGTIESPGFVGSAGIAAIGEKEAAARIFYGIPDALGSMRTRYAGRHTLVVGSGHSALNALLDLAQLAIEEPSTRITWAIRRPVVGQLLGGARNDQLEERGRLGANVRQLLSDGRITLVTGFKVSRVLQEPDGVVVVAGTRSIGPVDEIVAATGFRPDWSILSEVRLDLDPAVQSTRALAPLIDPNIHSCGTVRPHGAEELKHPEKGLFVIGMKSYGRAPTFLMMTGYEQARSVVSAIAGDWEAARRVELVLPETGVCSTDRDLGGASCCGTDADLALAAPAPRTGKLLATIEPAKTGCC